MSARGPAVPTPPPPGAGLDAVLSRVWEQRGLDLTGYKRASLARRIDRRLEALGLTSYDDYLDRLAVRPDELTRLLDTILVNVTAFFRDPDDWDHLRDELLPPLLRRREGLPIRVWSAGCASGEEACTLAMVLAEAIGVGEVRERVRIYATDVDEEALAHARAASYTERDLGSVPEALRERYFDATGDRFVLHRELRRSIVFGRHDLVRDAPISHVDLLTCRNTLMYFTAETQQRILDRMHVALRPDGVLFLGRSEMLLSHAACFRPVDLERRLFTKIDTEPRDRHAPDLEPAPARPPHDDVHLARLRRAALVSSAAARAALDTEGGPTSDDVAQRRRLQRALELATRRLEAAHDELLSTTEQLETTTEELRSTREELETVHQQLASVDDELRYTDDALRERQDEVDRLDDLLSAVLGSLGAAVAVLDADLRLLAWSSRAADLWGGWTAEAVGERLADLDVGLPVEQLRARVRARRAGETAEPHVLLVDGVDRHGRAVQVRATLTDVRDGATSAAVVVLEVVDPEA